MAAVAAASELEAVSLHSSCAAVPDGVAWVWEAAVLSAWRRVAWIALHELLEAIGEPFGEGIFINPIDGQRWIAGAFEGQGRPRRYLMQWSGLILLVGTYRKS